MAYLVVIVVGFAFGGADQYLGSRSALGPWASSVSLMSAPWLVLPFVVGWTQVRPRRAMALGLVATQAALVGYFVLTLSPLEGVSPAGFPSDVVHLMFSSHNLVYVLGGLVTGALYGLLGQRWRVERSWISAALVAGALCLEPLARRAAGQLSPAALVWNTEVAVGAALAVFFVFDIASHRRASATLPSSGPTI